MAIIKTNDISKLKYCLSNINTSSKFLLELINNIFDMSKIEANKFEIHIAPISIEKILLNTQDLFAEQAGQKDIDFNIIYDKDMRMNYMGDGLRLSQVIINILSNAIKFTPENGEVAKLPCLGLWDIIRWFSEVAKKYHDDNQTGI